MTDFHTVYVSPRSIELVNQVLSSVWISEGEMVAKFEHLLSEELGLSNPVALNSGTAALHLALSMIGVGDSDEVIVPAQTFVATAMAVMQCGATPVFADIDPHTGNLSVEDLESRITPYTRVIIPVHYGGLPCDMDEINAIGYTYGLEVIEDAAHALGATYRGKPVGSISRFTAFSFQAIKHLTTGDGGALCCTDIRDADEARRLRWFGIDRRAPANSLGVRDYDIQEVGYKCHMNNIAAAIGVGNIETLVDRLAERSVTGAYYRHALANVPGVRLLRVDADREHAYWVFTILVERRGDFIRAMAERGAPVAVIHTRIDAHSIFGGKRHDLPGQDDFDERQISLPMHDAQMVVDAIKEGW